MARWGKCDFKQLEQFKKRLEKMAKADIDNFCEGVAKELAARLLSKVIPRTPVGDYSGDKYITKKGKIRHRSYKTVKFTTNNGKNVNFKAKTTGKIGGTLRRGWTARTEAEAKNGTGKNGKNPSEYANSLKVLKMGNNFIIIVENPVHYSSYVENGHRTRNHKGWVDGKFMLAISEKELNAQADKIIEKKLTRFLGECFKDE